MASQAQLESSLADLNARLAILQAKYEKLTNETEDYIPNQAAIQEAKALRINQIKPLLSQIDASLDSISKSTQEKLDKAEEEKRAFENLFFVKTGSWTTIRGLVFAYLSFERINPHLIFPCPIDLFEDNQNLIKWAVDTSTESYTDTKVTKEEYIA
jgi:hypothetical protein